VFERAFTTAMNKVVNLNARGDGDLNPTATLLAKFVDMVMKGKDERGQRLTGDEAIEAQNTRVHHLLA